MISQVKCEEDKIYLNFTFLFIRLKKKLFLIDSGLKKMKSNKEMHRIRKIFNNYNVSTNPIGRGKNPKTLISIIYILSISIDVIIIFLLNLSKTNHIFLYLEII